MVFVYYLEDWQVELVRSPVRGQEREQPESLNNDIDVYGVWRVFPVDHPPLSFPRLMGRSPVSLKVAS